MFRHMARPSELRAARASVNSALSLHGRLAATRADTEAQSSPLRRVGRPAGEPQRRPWVSGLRRGCALDWAGGSVGAVPAAVAALTGATTGAAAVVVGAGSAAETSAGCIR